MGNFLIIDHHTFSRLNVHKLPDPAGEANRYILRPDR